MIKNDSVANKLIMGSVCSSRNQTSYDDFEERYAPKKASKEDENPTLEEMKRDLSRSISKPSTEEISVNESQEPTQQPRVRRVRHGVDWNDLERNVQAMNLQLLREDLHENPERFLINQILLSVQFFKNFERLVF